MDESGVRNSGAVQRKHFEFSQSSEVYQTGVRDVCAGERQFAEASQSLEMFQPRVRHPSTADP